MHILFVTPPPSFHLCKPSVQCVGLGGHLRRQLPCHHIREREREERERERERETERERERDRVRERRRDCEFSMHTYSASMLLEANYLSQSIHLNMLDGIHQDVLLAVCRLYFYSVLIFVPSLSFFFSSQFFLSLQCQKRQHCLFWRFKIHEYSWLKDRQSNFWSIECLDQSVIYM